MSRIDDLINDLCPDGVEFKTLGELFGTIPRGKRLTKANLSEVGSIPVFHGGLEPIGFHDQYNTQGMTVMVINTGASSGNVGWSDEPFWCSDGCFAFPHSDSALARYLYYCAKLNEQFFTDRVRKAGIPTLAASSVLALRIPFPPIEIQREIVSILDKFTELEAELEAELNARRKQYEHYRNQLLTFSTLEEGGVRWFTVDEICEVTRGRVMSKDYLREHPGTYPVYSSQTLNSGIFGFIDSFDFDFESITWTTDGANAGSVFYHKDEKFSLTNVCGLLKVLKPDELLTRYLYFQLGKVAKAHVSAGMGNPKLMATAMKAIRIPVPPMERQQQIVEVLDKLDEIVEGVSSGLPAEISARRKQYEYYRDKLLTFKELKVA